jgi:hypothetical protein
MRRITHLVTIARTTPTLCPWIGAEEQQVMEERTDGQWYAVEVEG